MALTYEELIAKARELAAEGRTDEARRVGEIALAVRNQSQTQSTGLERAMAPINEGIVRGLDSMARPVNRATNAAIRGVAGLFGNDDPYQFSTEPTRDIMANVGIDTMDGREPANRLERGLVGAGEAASYLLPLSVVGRGLQAASGVGQAVGNFLTKPFVNTPARAVAAEMGAGAGAAVGEDLAVDMSGSDNALTRTAGNLVGGLAGSVAPAAALRGATRGAVAVADALPVTGTLMRGVRAAVTPFTREGAFVRASDRVRDLVADPDAAAAAMRGENPGDLTPAQMSRDPNLLSLERTVMDEDPRLRDQLLARQRASQEVLTEELRAPAQGQGAEAAQRFMAQRQEAFRQSIERRVVAAEERARERVMRLDPARRESENSLIVREELDRAYDAASNQERALWGAVPRNVEVPVDFSRETFANLVQDTPQALADDIPLEARRLLGDEGFGDTTSVRELHGLYSRLRRSAREAMGQTVPNENRARIANNIADAILRDLGATGDMPTRAGQAINQARVFSAQMNEIFSQGQVGAVTSVRRSGGDAVPPELTLQRTIGQGGLPGAVAAQELRRAAGPAIDPAMQDFLRGRLTDRTIRQGQYSPERGDEFIRANRELLQQYPELQGDIGAANIATQRAQEQTRRVQDIVKRLDNPRETVTTAFIRATPGNEIAQAVFQTRNPAAAANALAQAARRDATGGALDGLKGAFLDHLINGAAGRYDTTGARPVSGNQLFGDLQDVKVRGALNRVFEPAEIQRMDRLAQAFQGLEGARDANAFDALMNDMPNAIIETAARVVAARQGAALGGGGGASLQTANMASTRMKALLGRLTNDRASQLLRDAVTDRDLFVALLTRTQTPAQMRRAETRLAEWMIGVGAVSAAELAQMEAEQ